MIIIKHGWAIFISIIVGFLFLAPQLIFQLSLGDTYQGIDRIVSGDERYYLTRGQEIIDGHYKLTNPYYFEHKEGQPMQFFLPDFLAAYPAKLLGFPVNNWYEFNDFLLPLISFLLVYLIFRQITSNQFWSIFFSLWMFLVQYYFLFNRPISPQIVFIFVATLTWLVINILKNSKYSNLWVVIATINFGLLFHLYPYYWTYWSTILALLVIYFWWAKNIILVKKIVTIFSGGLVIGLPYFYQTFLASRLSVFSETIERYGMIRTHIPSGFQIVIPAILLLCAYLLYNRSQERRLLKSNVAIFMVIAVLAGIINVNQHIITGRNQLFSSHYEPISYFFIAFALVYLIWESGTLVSFSKKMIIRVSLMLLLVILFIPNFFTQVEFNNHDVYLQHFAPVLNWLNNNTDPDDIILSYGEINDLITAYTHNNVFFNGKGGLYLLGNDEILNRFALYNYWIKNIDEQFVKDNFFSIFNIRYIAAKGKEAQLNKVKRLFGFQEKNLDTVAFPPFEVSRVLNTLQKVTFKEWLDSFRKYNVDYFIIDNNVLSKYREDFRPSTISKWFPNMELVYEINGVYVYKIIK